MIPFQNKMSGAKILNLNYKLKWVSLQVSELNAFRFSNHRKNFSLQNDYLLQNENVHDL